MFTFLIFCLISVVQMGGVGVMLWEIFPWHILGPLVPVEYRLNSAAYSSTVVNHVCSFMTTMYTSFDEFTVLQWPPQSPDQSNKAPLGCGRTGGDAVMSKCNIVSEKHSMIMP